MPTSSPLRTKLQTSKLLQDFLQRHSGERIYLRDLLNEMSNRAFAPLIFICALPEALPLPVAGVSAIIGIPLMIISGQLMLGFSKPWLPKWIANRSLKRKDFEKIIKKILHYLQKCERVIRPRWRFVTSPLAQRLLGLLFLVLAFVIALPIPFGNLPPAVAIAIISLGIIEQDGVVIVLGVLAACAILVIMASAIAALLSVVLVHLR
ncbi:MAG: exopolysaccharide biosynthesis protein [Chlorogloeopsis fritschii C42_A2020_084]|uniref:exopolysaccharide biosynthesis protein n=1 Tax=Chlorogloeopsis fritschii TaxID=1124 RepID=UPI0019D9EF4F|nr:exopolysaccharide biosynthesis protein [Chlorogloeopsis fritschii]MBF2008816.1 exopolysaccharide biosynthesis protein [Chlorogloeopsis fritschii C42_A2020_084]